MRIFNQRLLIKFLIFINVLTTTLYVFCYFLPLYIYYVKRSTADLETFQNEILTYASKRHSYCPPVYRARNHLAALDHNIHVSRPDLTKDDGSPRY